MDDATRPNGYAFTGRDPSLLTRLIAEHGDEIWAPIGDTPDTDRGDPHTRPAPPKGTP